MFLIVRFSSKPSFLISHSVHEQYSRTELEGGELLVTLVGSPGQCIFAESEMQGWNVARALAVLRLKNPELVHFVRLVFSTRAVQHFIETRCNTTVQKTLNLKDIKEIPIPIPQRNERERIEQVTSSIEKKMVINKKTNQTLEQIAQTLFKSWFVDFDPVHAKANAIAAGRNPERAAMATIAGFPPEVVEGQHAKQRAELNKLPAERQHELAATAALFPGEFEESELGEVPKGWKAGILADIVEFNPKRTLKKGTLAPYLDMKGMPTQGHLAEGIYDREMGSGIKFVNGDTLLARITPCLQNGKTSFVDFLEDEQVGWGSTEYIVLRSKGAGYIYFSYFIARHEAFRNIAIQSMTGSSGRQRANANTLSSMPWVIPPETVLIKFSQFVDCFMKRIRSTGNENKFLAELRDTLLPKLLSGELQPKLAETQPEQEQLTA